MEIDKILIALFIGGKTEKVRLHHIQIIVGSDFVQVLIHIQRDIIIRLQDTDVFAGRPVQACVHGLSITAVRLVDDHDPFIFLLIAFQNRQGLIGRAIIHTDDLDVLQRLAYDAVHALMQILLHIISRYYD